MQDVPRSTALMLLDITPVTVPEFGGDDEFLKSLAAVSEFARKSGCGIVYTRVAFNPGFPEVSASNKVFTYVVRNYDFLEGSDSTRIHPSLTVEPGDKVITKRRVSAFHGTDLELSLRSAGITDLVLAGVSTSGVVLSTLRQAADMDFSITVLSDCCADHDEFVHQTLLSHVFPAHAEVISSAEWMNRSRSSRVETHEGTLLP
ncbi:isochorismatase family cysteine hydrolase [Nocardia sp. NPDC004860]|uniref:cysteine hydrolase family protein n=1 Tax=Nocardia sp. NPDC004860 TaxID=3154557 RepID=UPI0033B660F6